VDIQSSEQSGLFFTFEKGLTTMSLFKVVTLAICVGLTGCTHIADLMACRQPRPAPEMFSDHLGHDRQSVDEVRCSNDELRIVQLARKKEETSAVLR
jgi:hypothetical protein